ncbi:cerberus-like [Hydractinia symbiolongicarpus]|uniref:cerberus-like n=1 Tax=Hydractinia symbiolongicarpus TaxID=13093 RepID=UPI002550790B|nr:cerberus-like [Hydractinia symbiolongicarpus]XP_057305090.1 cerberus-like [Hydractinia symbiolongicarpus]
MSSYRFGVLPDLQYPVHSLFRMTTATYCVNSCYASKTIMDINEKKLEKKNASLINSRELCLGVRFNQAVLHHDCIPAVIRNKLCVGFCKSISIPNMKGDVDRKCRYCMEDKTVITDVKLKCISRKRKFKIKKIKIVKTCKCQDIKMTI